MSPSRDSEERGLSMSNLFGAGFGVVFLLYNSFAFHEHYVLKHDGATAPGTVTDSKVVRRKGGISYTVDYVFNLEGHHYAGSGTLTQQTFGSLRIGGPIDVRYVRSNPSVSETAEMSHEDASLLFHGLVGLPVSLFIIVAALRQKRAPPEQYLRRRDAATAPPTAPAVIELPHGIQGIAYTMYPVADMQRARHFYENDLGLRASRDFRGEWVEYNLWDNCFALSTMVGDSIKSATDAGASIALEVDDVDALILELKKKGVRIKKEPFSTSVCRMAVILDSEGNVLTLHKRTV